jgi:hypothetical protein
MKITCPRMGRLYPLQVIRNNPIIINKTASYGEVDLMIL